MQAALARTATFKGIIRYREVKAMIRRSANIFALLAGIGLSQAVAASVPISGIWDVRDQQGMSVGDFFDPSWIALTNETVRVTSLYVLGDNYAIYDNGAQVASTSAADWTATGNGSFGAPYTVDPSTAWATTGPFAFAHASFSVHAGDVVTIKVTSLPTDFTDGAVVVVGVPEATTWAMAMIGFFGLAAVAGLARRRADRCSA
jgi:hypothetical protein